MTGRAMQRREPAAIEIIEVSRAGSPVRRLLVERKARPGQKAGRPGVCR
jgi:hypothetical protein